MHPLFRLFVSDVICDGLRGGLKLLKLAAQKPPFLRSQLIPLTAGFWGYRDPTLGQGDGHLVYIYIKYISRHL